MPLETHGENLNQIQNKVREISLRTETEINRLLHGETTQFIQKADAEKQTDGAISHDTLENAKNALNEEIRAIKETQSTIEQSAIALHRLNFTPEQKNGMKNLISAALAQNLRPELAAELILAIDDPQNYAERQKQRLENKITDIRTKRDALFDDHPKTAEEHAKNDEEPIILHSKIAETLADNAQNHGNNDFIADPFATRKAA